MRATRDAQAAAKNFFFELRRAHDGTSPQVTARFGFADDLIEPPSRALRPVLLTSHGLERSARSAASRRISAEHTEVGADGRIAGGAEVLSARSGRGCRGGRVDRVDRCGIAIGVGGGLVGAEAVPVSLRGGRQLGHRGLGHRSLPEHGQCDLGNRERWSVHPVEHRRRDEGVDHGGFDQRVPVDRGAQLPRSWHLLLPGAARRGRSAGQRRVATGHDRGRARDRRSRSRSWATGAPAPPTRRT